MRGQFAVVLLWLAGCASVAPLDEAERARIRVVVPVGALSAPQVDFKAPPGRGTGAAMGVAGGAGSVAHLCLPWGTFAPAGMVMLAPVVVATGAIGAAVVPSNEGLEPMIERARGQLGGAGDLQKLLAQRFAERVQRLTPYAVDAAAGGSVEGAVVANLAVRFVGATLTEPAELFGPAYASRPVRLVLLGSMELVRRHDGATLFSRNYLVGRYARRLQEYQKDGGLLLRAVAGAVDELATLMVDDAFLLRADAAAVPGIAPTALEPSPGRPCLGIGLDCWSFLKVKQLERTSPTFRWQVLSPPQGARNVVYDLWIFGGDDDRLIEGLTGTEHALERPLAPCTRYSWAVRARFDTDAGPRATDWSSASAVHKSAFGSGLRPAFGSPFITPCGQSAG
jgi:hypothetical protein